MRMWQAAGIGLVLGVAGTLGLGAIGRTELPVGPFFQANNQEIINTSQIQTANFVRWGQQQGPTRWAIQLTFENGKEDVVLFDTDEQARGAWKKLQGLLGVEGIAPPEK